MAAKTPLVGGSFNLEFGRDHGTVLAEVKRLLVKHDLDFLIIQEGADYRATLTHVPGYRYVVGKSRGISQVGILVKRTHQATSARFGFFGDGWNTETGYTHAPVTIPRVTVNGWLRVAGIHMPTPIVWHGDRMEGPSERIDDYKVAALKVIRFLRAPTAKAKLIAGDWNETPETKGKWAPAWLAKVGGAKIVAPLSREGHYRIDYPVFKGCRIEHIFKDTDIRENSDHEPVIFTVHPAR